MTSTASPPPHESALRGFDRSVTHLLGVDMRILYGMGVPILVIVGLVIVLALQPAEWLVGVILVVEVAALGLILKGIAEILNSADIDAED